MGELDTKNRDTFRDRESARRGLKGILEGDIIKRADGKECRVTYVWEDGVQTNTWQDCAEHSGEFHLNNLGGMEYSGSLEPAIPLEQINPLPTCLRKVACWIFHHNIPAAFSGVTSYIDVNEYELIEPHNEKER